MEHSAQPPSTWTNGPPAAASSSLRDVIDALGSVVLEVEAAPLGVDTAINNLVIQDPDDPSAVETGDLILAVGVRPETARAVETIRTASASGATAVILRGSVPPELVAEAEQSGIAILSVESEVSWSHLHALLRRAVAMGERMLSTGDNRAPVGDLFTLANAVAAMVGGPVTIEDPQWRILAFSNLGHPIDEPRRQTILGRKVPREWVDRYRSEGFLTKLWETGDVLRHGGTEHDRLAVAVRAGGEILGSIWASDGGQGFQESAYDAMREAAAMASLHLVRHGMGEDLERRMRGEVLRSLLAGRGSVEVTAQRLGTDIVTPATVIAFEVSGDDDAAVALARERVRELVVIYCESYRRRIADVTMDRMLYVLLFGTTKSGDVDGMAARLARDVVGRADGELGVAVRGAIGSTVNDLSHVPRSRAEADRVLEVFARYGFARRTAHVDDVRSYTALLELENLMADRPHLRLQKLDELAAHDEAHGSEYLPTLRAYLDAFGDVIQAAETIHVHPNTVRYRLRRLSELSKFDLDNPDERLVIELQLRTK